MAQLAAAQFSGTVTVLSSRDDAPAELLELAALPLVSVRFGQPASHIDAGTQVVTTADGMEFGYDQLVIATGSAPVDAPVDGSGRCLSYSTIDDATGSAKPSRTSPGSWAGGRWASWWAPAAAGQAEAVLRARGVRPVRTTAPARRRRADACRLRAAGRRGRLRGRQPA